MNFKVEVTEAEFIRFNEANVMTSDAGRAAVLRTRILMPVISVIFLVAMLILGAGAMLMVMETVILAALCIVFGIRAPKMVRKNIRKNVNRMKKDGKLPFSEYARVEFSDLFISHITETSTRRVRYDEVTRLLDDEGCYFLMIGSGFGLILPKKYLGSQVQEVKLLLEMKTGLTFLQV